MTTLGVSSIESVSADPFAVYKALRQQRLHWRKHAAEVRQRIYETSTERAELRRQQIYSSNINSNYLTKVKSAIAIVGAGGGAGGDKRRSKQSGGGVGGGVASSSSFEIDARDHRMPHPHHRGCEVVQIREWLAKQQATFPQGHSGRRGSLRRVSSMSSDGSVEQPHPHELPQLLASKSNVARTTSSSHLQQTLHAATNAVALSQSSARNNNSHTSFAGRDDRGGGSRRQQTANQSAGGQQPSDASHAISLPSLDRMSPRVISNAEQDFAVFSYGKTHAPASVFEDLASDFVMDLSGRRISAYQFQTFLKRTRLDSLSFPQYLHVVYSLPVDECVAAAKRWSFAFGWAAELTEETAVLVQLLWKKWTEDGSLKFDEEKYMTLMGANSRDERRFRDLQCVFRVADADGDGFLDRDEFTLFFSGGEVGGSRIDIHESRHNGRRSPSEGSRSTTTVADAMSRDTSPRPTTK